MLERRVSLTNLTTKRSAGGGNVIRGYAARYNSLSENLGGFREFIRVNAFYHALESDPDVRCLFNHNADLILGRTASGTLRLSDDGKGLAIECDMPNTTVANDLMESIRRGDVNQMSFGFRCLLDNWMYGSDYVGTESVDPDEVIRELVDINLDGGDCSPVTYPAYESTEVYAD
jgi:HK97 family phage prohead protease